MTKAVTDQPRSAATSDTARRRSGGRRTDSWTSRPTPSSASDALLERDIGGHSQMLANSVKRASSS